jgi:DNA-binding NarL/FixJ family response regulator/two-component sensor histidine kinase
VQEATERERARLSRDLYDTVAQAVPAINSIAADLQERLASVDERAAQDAARIVELSDLELADMRRAIIGMSPRELDNHTLEEVVESRLANFTEATGIDVTWTVDGDTSALPGALQRAAYRVLQELLTNVRIHSGAATLRVQLAVGDGLSLVVEDDGVGFDAQAITTDPGLGLHGMIERATALGGSFSVESAPGEGTRARFEIPAVGDADVPLATPQPELDSAAEAEAGATLRVFVAERHNLIRSGLIRTLERAGAIRVVGESGNAKEVRGQVCRFCPDVVLLDERLEAEYPSGLIKELTEESPGSAILITTRNATGGGEELLETGGSGIVHKGIEPDELVDAVRAVANGARLVTGPASAADEQENGTSPLSKRERGVLELIAAGQTNAEIAEALFFATKTVERHVATIVSKLGARTRAHAAALAASRQIISVDDR